jgi:hypothetical protein
MSEFTTAMESASTCCCLAGCSGPSIVSVRLGDDVSSHTITSPTKSHFLASKNRSMVITPVNRIFRHAIGDFTSYSGQLQNWPTQPGSFVSTNYVIPAYVHSWPDRPYMLLGYLDATTAPIRRFSAPLFLGKAEVLAIKWKQGNREDITNKG